LFDDQLLAQPWLDIARVVDKLYATNEKRKVTFIGLKKTQKQTQNCQVLETTISVLVLYVVISKFLKAYFNQQL